VAPESVKGLPLCFGDVFDDVLDGSHAIRAVGFPDRVRKSSFQESLPSQKLSSYPLKADPRRSVE
jgi:hypothetical protein